MTARHHELGVFGLFAIAALVACSSTSSNDGSGGSGGAAGNGAGQGGNATTELADGTLGSSCGTCTAPLTCITDASVPGGYCTTTCSDQTCGDKGVCYATQGGNYCLRKCGSNADCRTGYSCQGDPGNTVCFPGGGSGGSGAGGGGSGTGCIDAATLTSTWWQPTTGGSLEQIKFNANGSLDYEYYTAVSGATPYGGSWQLSCPTLTANIESSKPYVYTVQANGSLVHQATGRTWVRCTQPVSSGKCFLSDEHPPRGRASPGSLREHR